MDPSLSIDSAFPGGPPLLPALDAAARRVLSSVEIVTDPKSETLAAFHQMLVREFQAEECEELATFQRELARNSLDPDVRFICVAMRDGERVVSGSYGSVQDGALAVRFTLTEEPYRGLGISQRASGLLVEAARDFCASRSTLLSAIGGECVDRSEAYWNRLSLWPENGMRRLYLESPDRTSYAEMPYEIPPLAWNRDGTPARDGMIEHLQIALAGQDKEVLPGTLEGVLKRWWEVWYIRPSCDFDGEEAWQRHQEQVWGIFESRIMRAIRSEKGLIPISRDKRVEMIQDGYIFKQCC